MIFIGVDPGHKGAVVALNPKKNSAHVMRLKFSNDGLFDKSDFEAFVGSFDNPIIYFEKVKAGQGWGSTQIFNFGAAWGQVYSAIAHLKVPYFLVTPQQWQKDFYHGIETKLSAKAKTMIAYKRLYPNNPIPAGPRGGAIDNNVVDALMIASYGAAKNGTGCCMILDYREFQYG